MVMLFTFLLSSLIAWLAFQANDPVSAWLGYIVASWLFISGLISTYVVSKKDDD